MRFPLPPLYSWKTCHLPLTSPLPLLPVLKGPFLKPIRLLRSQYVINVVLFYAEFRIFMLNICMGTRHANRNIWLCVLRSGTKVLSCPKVRLPSRWCKDLKQSPMAFCLCSPLHNTGFCFTLLQDEDQQDLQGSVLLSDQVDSKQVPLPECFSSQRIKDRRPYLNCL